MSCVANVEIIRDALEVFFEFFFAFFDPFLGCLLRSGVLYANGESYQRDVCTSCTCRVKSLERQTLLILNGNLERNR